MSIRIVLLLSAVLYIGFVYWVGRRLNYTELWRGSLGDEFNPSQGLPSSRLTAFVKGVLDIFMVLLTIVIVIWPPMLVVMGFSQSVNPTWGMDISVFSGFNIDINAFSSIESTGLRHPEISGKTLLNIDTSNLQAWYLFAVNSEIGAMISLYGLVQLRALVISVKAGEVFSKINSLRIKKLGFVLIIWNVLQPFVQYFGWGNIVTQIKFSTEGLLLYPAFEINGMVIFIGLLMILLSDMFNKAADLSNEQRLTI